MHMFPQLRKLEQRYPDEIVVIGVHAAKFTLERETETIRWAMLRFGIEHPVVNDRDFRIWQSYAVRAWPTLVFVDPRGKVIGQHAGELPFDTLEQLAGEMVTEFDSLGMIDRRSVTFRMEDPGSGLLAFPAKLTIAGDRLYVADTNHHRIVVTDLDGNVLQTYGSGPGFRDGPDGQFDRPHGIAVVGETLYVADTENHAIRRVELGTGVITTVAGTGQQAHGFAAGGLAHETALRSPWDLVEAGGTLYIAMAGSHQLWALEPDRGIIYPFAGAGPEALQDGSLSTAYLAQPSGITLDGSGGLVFADSETSAIRRADLDQDGDVTTYVGRDLFEFGDIDGLGDQVRLQHPIGVHWADGLIWIADSFNNKIKRLDPATREVRTFAGTGQAGHRDGPAAESQFNEPEGIWAQGGRLYVADTNNSAIRVIDLATEQVTTLTIRSDGG